MKYICIISVISILFTSCKKDDTISGSFSEAAYTLTITGKWKSPEFTVPGGAHYTTFIGMIHNNNASLWKENEKASPGTEVLAETGGGGPLLAEIDSMIAARTSLSLILFVAPSTITSANANFYCNSNYTRVSFESMLGPTPDWFVGINSINLYNGSRWVTDTTINLYAYDAGTEEGDVFGYTNPPTVPQQNIHLLQASQATVLANGNTTLAPVATARFIKQ